jgi:hypothetical protein
LLAIHRSTGLPPWARCQIAGQHELLKALRRGAHARIPLAELNHLEAVPFKLRPQLRRVPAVDGDREDQRW